MDRRTRRKKRKKGAAEKGEKRNALYNQTMHANFAHARFAGS